MREPKGEKKKILEDTERTKKSKQNIYETMSEVKSEILTKKSIIILIID